VAKVKTAQLEKFEVRNRWTGAVQFTSEIETIPDMTPRIKLGLAVRWGYKSGADLSGADLSDAVLSGADLRGAVLRDADLRGAVLSDADLSECPVKIPDIHKAVFEAASQPQALDMGTWHRCETTHCRAGWVVTLAGDGGKALELAMGTPVAAAMIYLASDPNLEKMPNFYASNEAAMEDMKRLAEQAPA